MQGGNHETASKIKAKRNFAIYIYLFFKFYFFTDAASFRLFLIEIRTVLDVQVMFTDAASAELCTSNREKHRTGLGKKTRKDNT